LLRFARNDGPSQWRQFAMTAVHDGG